MPDRTRTTTSPWNGFEGGTSRKSAIQPSPRVPVALPGLVTATSFSEPAGRAGTVAWMCVASVTVTPVAGMPPIFTVAPATNPAPPIVAANHPPEAPEPGLIASPSGADGSGVGVRDGVREGV